MLCENCKVEIRSVPTLRELQIAKLMAQGYKMAQVAKMLNISVKTVDAHRDHIFTKLKIHRRAQLMVWLVKEGHITMDKIFDGVENDN